MRAGNGSAHAADCEEFGYHDRMKHLLVLRHAKSSWKHDGLSDHDRPLNKRGLRDAPRIGQLIRERNILPDRILSSTAVRACTTAVQVGEAAGIEEPPVLVPTFYLAAPSAYLEMLATLDDAAARAMVVGHNPGLEELVYHLTGRDETLPTAALAHVELPLDSWSEIDGSTRGKLLDLWLPRELSDSDT